MDASRRPAYWASYLTLILLTLTIWRAPTNASKWRMEFNSAFKELSQEHKCLSLEVSAYPNPEMWINLRRNLFTVITDDAKLQPQRKMRMEGGIKY